MTFASMAHAAGYLGGIIDGEGCVHLSRTKSRSITITNTDASIISAVRLAAEMIGVTYRLYERDNQRRGRLISWEVAFFRHENLQRIYEVVPLADRKRVKLASLLDSYKPPAPTAESIRLLYEDGGMSLRAVASRLHVSKSGLQNLMAAYGITARPVGQRSPARVVRCPRGHLKTRTGATGRLRCLPCERDQSRERQRTRDLHASI